MASAASAFTRRTISACVVTLNYAHPAVGPQEIEMRVSREIVQPRCWRRARTFGFVQDFEGLRAMGLIRGGSLENAIVLDDRRRHERPVALPGRIRPAQGAGPDRRSGAGRPAAAGARRGPQSRPRPAHATRLRACWPILRCGPKPPTTRLDADRPPAHAHRGLLPPSAADCNHLPPDDSPLVFTSTRIVFDSHRADMRPIVKPQRETLTIAAHG